MAKRNHPDSSGADIAKHLHLDRSPPERSSITTLALKCHLAPHRQPVAFQTWEEYELHYNKNHVHRCTSCQKNMPTEHFLNLHIAENHDSLRQIREARGEKTFACFVEDCGKVCSSSHKRRLHLIDKHLFPKDYDFFIVNDGTDRRSSMLKQVPMRKNRHRITSSAALGGRAAPRALSTNGGPSLSATVQESSDDADSAESSQDESRRPKAGAPITAAFSQAQEASATLSPVATAGEDIEAVTKSMSALNFVPPSVRFGRGRGRTGFAKG